MFFSRCHMVVWKIRAFDRCAGPVDRVGRVHSWAFTFVLVPLQFALTVAIQIPVPGWKLVSIDVGARAHSLVGMHNSSQVGGAATRRQLREGRMMGMAMRLPLGRRHGTHVRLPRSFPLGKWGTKSLRLHWLGILSVPISLALHLM